MGRIEDSLNRADRAWWNVRARVEDKAYVNRNQALRLLEDGEEGTARVVGIRVRTKDTGSVLPIYEYALEVTPPAGSPFRAACRQQLAHEDWVRLGMEVPVRFEKEAVAIDGLALTEAWGLEQAENHEYRWKQLSDVPEEGIEDTLVRKPKGTEVRATLLSAERQGTVLGETENFNLRLRVDPAEGDPYEAEVARDDVPGYARHLLEPGTSLPAVARKGRSAKVAIDWQAAALAEPGVGVPPVAAVARKEQPAPAGAAAAPSGSAEPDLAPVEGVEFDTWVAVEVGLQNDRVPPADYDAHAQGYGVPAGGWERAQAAWQAKQASDWRVGAGSGRPSRRSESVASAAPERPLERGFLSLL
ncbi:MAG: hypothetical protein EXQ70_09290 [Solirubrobacterales bacterium]|nr:hypothetical protein [Solirubrobacterales bacterium]